MGALLGYARVSTGAQDLALQHDALSAAGCLRIFDETASGALDDRPQLAALLDHLREGDTLVVWRLDRLGRSLRHLVETVTALAARGVGFRSLQESIDTTTPGGRLVFHVFAALAEFERDLISERTRAGLAAARARGRKGGRPTVMTPAKLKVAQEMYASREHTTAAIASVVGVSRATLYRALAANPATASSPPAAAPSSSAKQASVIAPTRPSAAAPADKPPAPASAEPRVAPARRRRRAGTAELPSAQAARARECPRCGAQPGKMCRDTHSHAKRKPAAAALHAARFWLDRRCPVCRAPAGQPCLTPSGRLASKIHAARLHVWTAEVDAGGARVPPGRALDRAEQKMKPEDHVA